MVLWVLHIHLCETVFDFVHARHTGLSAPLLARDAPAGLCMPGVLLMRARLGLLMRACLDLPPPCFPVTRGKMGAAKKANGEELEAAIRGRRYPVVGTIVCPLAALPAADMSALDTDTFRAFPDRGERSDSAHTAMQHRFPHDKLVVLPQSAFLVDDTAAGSGCDSHQRMRCELFGVDPRLAFTAEGMLE